MSRISKAYAYGTLATAWAQSAAVPLTLYSVSAAAPTVNSVPCTDCSAAAATSAAAS